MSLTGRAGRGAVALPQTHAVLPSLAAKNSVPSTFVRYGFGVGIVPVAVLMSLTRTVPAAVPSLFHSSQPCVHAVIGREEQRAVDVGDEAGP